MTKEFPRGYKQWHILKMADDNQGCTTYTEIIKLAFELSNGKGTYTSEFRGYWSGIFKSPSHYSWGNKIIGWANVLFNHVGKKYILNSAGRKRLEKLNKKFEGKTLSSRIITKFASWQVEKFFIIEDSPKAKKKFATHYKVIKKYPNGPEVGAIINGAFIGRLLIENDPHKYPEFFEEFIPLKNYQVIFKLTYEKFEVIQAASLEEAKAIAKEKATPNYIKNDSTSITPIVDEVYER